MFNTESCMSYVKGERFGGYRNVVLKTASASNKTIRVPDHCSVNVKEDKELKATCKREFFVNSQPVSCSVLFGVTKTVLKV